MTHYPFKRLTKIHKDEDIDASDIIEWVEDNYNDDNGWLVNFLEWYDEAFGLSVTVTIQNWYDEYDCWLDWKEPQPTDKEGKPDKNYKAHHTAWEIASHYVEEYCDEEWCSENCPTLDEDYEDAKADYDERCWEEAHGK